MNYDAARICEVEDCDNPHKARGMCNMHLLRWKAHGVTTYFVPGTEDLPAEVWVPIREFPKYRVSNLGRVKYIADTVRIRKPHVFRGGYFGVTFRRNGRNTTRNLHRLVATAFIPNPDNLPEVNHKDGNKLNNHVNNLEWCTQAFNTLHAYESGLCKTVGERHHMNKLKIREVQEIRRYYGVFTPTQLANKYSVSRTLIRSIWNNKIWRHLDT